MRKTTILIFVLLLLVPSVLGYDFLTRYNAYTQKQDYFSTSNFTGYNLSANGLFFYPNCVDGQIVKWSGGMGVCGNDSTGSGVSNYGLILDAQYNLTNKAGLNYSIILNAVNISGGILSLNLFPSLTNFLTLDAQYNLTNKGGLLNTHTLSYKNITGQPNYYANGSYYPGTNDVSDSLSQAQAFNANSMRAMPWIAKGDAKIDVATVYIATANAATVCVFGTYNATINSSGEWIPDSLLLNTSAVNGSATGNFNFSYPSGVSVSKGQVYFDVYNCNSGTTVRYNSINTGAISPILGYDITSANAYTLWAVAYTYNGTLPATFPTTSTSLVGGSVGIGLYKRMRSDI